ncbi:MAG: DNA integrity scanning diadenylate cyclase DisA [Nitriliruptorales bacterium]|nr:DNA integrity scanning diadenylate cyclase DisA [Nitriliruptorales bacterium]
MANPTSNGDLAPVLGRLAPGTVLREGIERIIRAGRGALIVIGTNDAVESCVSGGFKIGINATAQRISELAKLDGALIVDDAAEKILLANVHLVPDHTIPTTETGTRHRSAERVAKQTGMPVVSVSESMSMVTLYYGERRQVLEEVSSLLFRANQGLATLERYRARLDEVAATLSAREVEDSVTLRDVALTLQRAEMVRRIAGEVEEIIAELGTEGRLIRLQLDELMASVDAERELIVEDYVADRRRKLSVPLAALGELDTEDLLELENIVTALLHEDPNLEQPVTPHGFRLLHKIPRLPDRLIRRLVQQFQTLPRLMDATLDELGQVEGIGAARARSIQTGLRRLAESTLLERYV